MISRFCRKTYYTSSERIFGGGELRDVLLPPSASRKVKEQPIPHSKAQNTNFGILHPRGLAFGMNGSFCSHEDIQTQIYNFLDFKVPGKELGDTSFRSPKY